MNAAPAVKPTVHTMRADEFRALAKRVLLAACKDPTRFHLNGALVEPSPEGGARFVTTDGHRLHLEDVPWTGEIKPMIIPARALEMALLAFKDGLFDVNVAIAGKEFTAVGGGYEVGAAAVSAKFPPYNMVIPKSSRTTIKVDRDTLRKIVRKATPGANGEIAIETDLAVEVDGCHLFVGSDRGDEGRASGLRWALAPVKATVTGRSGRAAYQRAYLDDALSSMPKGEITLEIDSGEHDPIKLTGGGFVGVIMPVRL